MKTPIQIRGEQADIAANKATCFFIKKIIKKYDLQVIGTGGGGAGGNGLNLLSVDFESYQKMDIPEARKLLIDCVQEFLSQINASEDLKQYLAVYPFTAQNIDIVIQYTDKKRPNFMNPPFLAVAEAYKGKNGYKIYEQKLKTIHTEIYEEALQILEKENQLNSLGLTDSKEDLFASLFSLGPLAGRQ